MWCLGDACTVGSGVSGGSSIHCHYVVSVSVSVKEIGALVVLG